jgi:hypothetical protein
MYIFLYRYVNATKEGSRERPPKEVGEWSIA